MEDLNNTTTPLCDRVILALDNMNEEQVLQCIEKHKGDFQYFKIGLEQFCKYGPELLFRIKTKHDVKFFLDLKLHDIPKTVAKAIQSLEGLPITFLTIHLSGGPEMVTEALAAAQKYLPSTLVLGVSLLTSMDGQTLHSTYGIPAEAFDSTFNNIVNMGTQAGLKGLVCSIQDLELVKAISSELISVCPGIRFDDQIAAGNNQDQKRVATPQLAKERKTNFLVIGRALTQAGDNWDKRMDLLRSL